MMEATIAARPPGPFETLLQLRRMLRNPIEELPREVYDRPLVRTRLLGRTSLYVTDPDLVKQIMVDDVDSFVQAERKQRALEVIVGRGIITADGAQWQLQRRTAAPVFGAATLSRFVPAMLSAARAMRDRWAKFPDGTAFDLLDEMMRVTFDIILATMLSRRGRVDDAHVWQSFADTHAAVGWQMLLAYFNLPLWTPYPGKWRARRGNAFMTHMIRARVDERRRTGERGDDLLSLLMDATDPMTGQGLAEIEIIDNIRTFIIGGHAATAVALCWTWFLLSRHPAVEHRVLSEIADVTGGASLEAAQVPQLHYTRAVIQEAMRLYPPIPMTGRRAIREMKIGGETVTPKDEIVLPIYAIHRHRRLWRDPDMFDPGNFAPDATAQRHRYAYLPFGAGPRICIGMGFALLDATAILATLLPRAQLATVPGFEPVAKMRVGLHPADGMQMQITRRP